MFATDVGNWLVLGNYPNMITESYLQIRSDSIIKYTLCPRNVFKLSADRLHSIEKFKACDTYTGELTPGAKKRLTKAIELLVMASKKQVIYNSVSNKMQPFRLNFITLTFSDSTFIIPGKEAHANCLEHFLQWMRRVHKCYSYVWKAEFQTKTRTQLHYHITCDKFIHWKEIRDKWNELQSRAGYMNDYYEEHGHFNANSTDVHATKHVKLLGRYLIKAVVKTMLEVKDDLPAGIVTEMGKDLQNKLSVNGKVWDCSNNIKRAAYFTVSADEWEYSEKIGKGIDKGYIDAFYSDNCVIYKFKNVLPFEILDGRDKWDYMEMMRNLAEREVLDKFKLPVEKPPEPPVLVEYAEKTQPVVTFRPLLTLFSDS